MSIDDITLIGLVGKKRSGKDTVGEYLVKEYGFVRLAYADALKDACKIIFSLNDEQLYGTDEQKEAIDLYWGYSARQILQQVGTGLFRETLPKLMPEISADIWIRVLHRQLLKHITAGKMNFVITDVRFPNEADFIAKLKGKLWKMERAGSSADNHVTESHIDNIQCDIIIDNNKTLNNLYVKIDQNMIDEI